MEFVEHILTPKLDGVFLHDHLHATVEGTLCITGHHLILSSRPHGNEELWLLHKNIDCVEKKPFFVNNVVMGGIITLKCKDLRVISLEIKYAKEYANIALSLEQLSKLKNLQMEYPFFYRPMYSILEDGFTMFSPEAEFSKLLAGDEWRITTVNKYFQICPTYGSILIVPKSITDEQIIQSSAYRDGGRFPILCYRHDNGAILMRSSQPLSPSLKRCRADEAILNVALGRSTKGFIVDSWGKGKSNTETDQHYSQWKKVNRSIGNISSPLSILDSFTKMVDASNDISCSADKWITRLESSGWLNYVLNSLNAACVVAQCLHQENSPVLVHGGNGLDSTLIVTSLVQIILHPDCRTVRGLQALVEREWIQAGHPFSTRHKFGCYSPANHRSKYCGATFILFLDCIFQLFCQFPCSFEFNTNMLIQIFEHSYFSQYGTFLGDCEKDRYDLQVQSKTTSLWSYLNRPEVLKNLLNPLYEPNSNVIWPSVAPISLEVWTELYLRWVIDQTVYSKSDETIQGLVTYEKELRTKVIKLRKQATDYSREALGIFRRSQ